MYIIIPNQEMQNDTIRGIDNVGNKFIKIASDLFKSNLLNLVSEISNTLDSIEEKTTKFEIKNVDINIGINIDGSVYIAKSGIESSFTISLGKK